MGFFGKKNKDKVCEVCGGVMKYMGDDLWSCQNPRHNESLPVGWNDRDCGLTRCGYCGTAQSRKRTRCSQCGASLV